MLKNKHFYIYEFHITVFRESSAGTCRSELTIELSEVKRWRSRVLTEEDLPCSPPGTERLVITGLFPNNDVLLPSHAIFFRLLKTQPIDLNHCF